MLFLFYSGWEDPSNSTTSLHLRYKPGKNSILPIMKTYNEIVERNRLDAAVLTYGFMHNVSQMVTRVASLGLNDKPSDVFLAKIKFNKLYQNNKFLSPNQSKTWKTLLQTDNQNQSDSDNQNQSDSDNQNQSDSDTKINQIQIQTIKINQIQPKSADFHARNSIRFVFSIKCKSARF